MPSIDVISSPRLARGSDIAGASGPILDKALVWAGAHPPGYREKHGFPDAALCCFDMRKHRRVRVASAP
jgi:hypothetical protein